MNRPTLNLGAAALLAALALALAGCGGAANSGNPEENLLKFELHEIWAIYDVHQKERSRPPAKLADLKPYEDGFPNGFQALQRGDCVAVWGVELGKLAEKGAGGSTLLAYRKEVPTQGGLVVFADGAIRTMTADQFQELRKGKG